ncbi:MAG: hypothetical protein CM15mV26_1030 [uncultured marine virus]|nr:MAG: hypothetical protein CM15mV26_1030 [uncultured marine virus]
MITGVIGIGWHNKEYRGDKDPYGFLPLVWAKVKEGESPKDTNFLEQTPLFESLSRGNKLLEKE